MGTTKVSARVINSDGCCCRLVICGSTARKLSERILDLDALCELVHAQTNTNKHTYKGINIPLFEYRGRQDYTRL